VIQRYFIHSRNGCIGDGTDTTSADVDAIVQQIKVDSRGHLVLHFHGGLVNKAAGFGKTARLAPAYREHAYPVFYVWESGFIEAIRNNLRELWDEPVFKQLVRKLLEYALQRLGGINGARSIAAGNVDPRKVRATVDAFWTHPDREHVPYRGFDPVADEAASRSAAHTVDLDEIQADLETDADFAAAFATLPDLPPHTRSAFAATGAVERRSPFSEAVADRVAEQAGARGLISWFKVALLVKRILVNLLSRYGSQRDHGLYATVVEEIVREVRLGGSGLNEWGKALQWNRMKQDALDAFGPDPDLHAGTTLLHRLNLAMADGLALPRITLIGHSTGAIYIAHWLAKAHAMLPPSVRFDLVFLAPAISYELFDRTITEYGQRIGQFRMFCMRDELERDDQVWGNDSELPEGMDWRRFVYPSSLLYLVSGILESRQGDDGELVDEPDMPLLGLERFFARTAVYGDQAFPAVARVRAWLSQQPHRLVWSKAEGQAAGLNCGSHDHGGFDDDATTLESLAAMLKGW
jgi:hypothetical protein